MLGWLGFGGEATAEQEADQAATQAQDLAAARTEIEPITTAAKTDAALGN